MKKLKAYKAHYQQYTKTFV